MKKAIRTHGTYAINQRAILQMVKDGMTLVADLSTALNLHGATVNIHLKALADRGDVDRYTVIRGKYRKYYSEFIKDSRGILSPIEIEAPTEPANPHLTVHKLSGRLESWWQRELRPSKNNFVSGSTLSSFI